MNARIMKQSFAESRLHAGKLVPSRKYMGVGIEGLASTKDSRKKLLINKSLIPTLACTYEL